MHEKTGEAITSISNRHTPPDALRSKDKILDESFVRDLKRLRDLRSYLIQEAVELPSGFSLGKLNLLHYSKEGRFPSEEEWLEVELKTQALFELLDEPLRQRFVRAGIPFWLAVLAIALALIAAVSLAWSVLIHDRGLFGIRRIGLATLPMYIVWLMSLGAIGSIAFIGMNALSVQQDVTFDLTNARLMVLRIVLGALFALVLTLPFGFSGFLDFVTLINRGGVLDNGAASDALGVSKQAILLLLPFVLGFSTSLVIMILNRTVDAVHAFFGKAGAGWSNNGTMSRQAQSLRRHADDRVADYSAE